MRRSAAGLALTVALLVGGAGPADASRHRRDRCRYDDCDRGGDGSGNSGGDYGHGQGGDQDGRGNCHSFCGNTIIVPDPTKKGGDQSPGSDG